MARSRARQKWSAIKQTNKQTNKQTSKRTRQYIKKKQAEKEGTAGFRNDIHIAAATTWRRRAGHVTRMRANHSRRRTDTMTPFAGEGKKKKTTLSSALGESVRVCYGVADDCAFHTRETRRVALFERKKKKDNCSGSNIVVRHVVGAVAYFTDTRRKTSSTQSRYSHPAGQTVPSHRFFFFPASHNDQRSDENNTKQKRCTLSIICRAFFLSFFHRIVRSETWPERSAFERVSTFKTTGKKKKKKTSG